MAESIFGPLIVSTTVEQAVEDTLKRWIDTYLGEVERRSAGRWRLRQITRPRSWEVHSDVHQTSDRQLPAVVVESAELDRDRDADSVDGQWGITVTAYAKGTNRRNTRATVAAYEAAISLILEHKGSLGGIAQATIVGGSRFDAVPSQRDKTLAGAEVRIAVFVPSIAGRRGGPDVPDAPPPTQLPETSPTDPERTSINVTFQEGLPE